MDEKTKKFGLHYLVEFVDCNPEKIKFVSDVKDVFLQAARESRATILDACFHQFEPYGMSGMIFIAESHFSIHTWPEERYAGVDILTCGEMYPDKAIDRLKTAFEARMVDVKIYQRGF